MVYYIWGIIEKAKTKSNHGMKDMEIPKIVIIEEEFQPNEFNDMKGRLFRNLFPMSELSNPDMKSNFVRVPPGMYGENFTVHVNGDILISHKAYSDDVIAFALKGMLDNPNIPDDIKIQVADILDKMDAIAVKRHGYSRSETQRNFEWKSLVEQIKNSKKVNF